MKTPPTTAAAPFRHCGPRGLLPEVGIPLLYLVFASAWIVISDLWLGHTALSSEQSVLVQLAKGLNFVVTSAVLLYFLLRRSYGGWRRAEKSRLAAAQESRERLRALNQHMETLRENERIRISREVHDELGQLLTAIKMEVRLLEDRLAERGDRTLHPAVDQLVELSGMVDGTIASVRRIACDLRPALLDDLGLDAALRDEAARFSLRFGIACRVETGEMPGQLPPEVATVAFRIFQEALTNVARHAAATDVAARLEISRNHLTLSVRDNGIGIDPAVLDAPRSLGITGMRERAANLGGQLSISRPDAGGTEVFLTIPVEAHVLPATPAPPASPAPPP